jgi:hypothetical protein
MKRLMMVAALFGGLLFAATSTSQAYPYVRPVPRVAARVALPPYGRAWVGPRYYGPRAYYGPGFYRPYYGYRAGGPGWYGPGFYGPRVGIGIY